MFRDIILEAGAPERLCSVLKTHHPEPAGDKCWTISKRNQHLNLKHLAMEMENINADHDTSRKKIRSFNTLNSLYHETQQEIELLNKQIQVKDNIITELKLRLGRYEGICLTAGNNEPLVIGPSKSLLESLCKEAWNPQQKMKDMELEAARQAEVKARRNGGDSKLWIKHPNITWILSPNVIHLMS